MLPCVLPVWYLFAHMCEMMIVVSLELASYNDLRQSPEKLFVILRLATIAQRSIKSFTIEN